MKYRVTIEELLCRQIEVEAETAEEALEKVEDQYKNGELVLTADDFSEVTFGLDLSNNKKESI